MKRFTRLLERLKPPQRLQLQQVDVDDNTVTLNPNTSEPPLQECAPGVDLLSKSLDVEPLRQRLIFRVHHIKSISPNSGSSTWPLLDVEQKGMFSLLHERLLLIAAQLELEPLAEAHPFTQDRKFKDALGMPQSSSVMNLLEYLRLVLVIWEQRLVIQNLRYILLGLNAFLRDLTRFRVESFLFWYYEDLKPESPGRFSYRCRYDPDGPRPCKTRTVDPRVSDSSDCERILDPAFVSSPLSWSLYINKGEYIASELVDFIASVRSPEFLAEGHFRVSNMYLYRCAQDKWGHEYALFQIRTCDDVNALVHSTSSWLRVQRGSDTKGLVENIAIATSMEELRYVNSIEMAYIGNLAAMGVSSISLKDLAITLSQISAFSGGFSLSNRNCRWFCRSLFLDTIRFFDTFSGPAANAHEPLGAKPMIRFLDTHRSSSGKRQAKIDGDKSMEALDRFLIGDFWDGRALARGRGGAFSKKQPCEPQHFVSSLSFVRQVRMAINLFVVERQTEASKQTALLVLQCARITRFGPKWHRNHLEAMLARILLLDDLLGRQGYVLRDFKAEYLALHRDFLAASEDFIPSAGSVRSTIYTGAANFSLGRALQVTGNYEEAKIHFEKARDLYARSQRSASSFQATVELNINPVALCSYHLAMLSISLNRYLQAEVHLREMYRESPNPRKDPDWPAPTVGEGSNTPSMLYLDHQALCVTSYDSEGVQITFDELVARAEEAGVQCTDWEWKLVKMWARDVMALLDKSHLEELAGLMILEAFTAPSDPFSREMQKVIALVLKPHLDESRLYFYGFHVIGSMIRQEALPAKRVKRDPSTLQDLVRYLCRNAGSMVRALHLELSYGHLAS